MTKRHDASFFERLIAPMLRHLRYIAKLTQGEHTVDDLKSEAWIIAEEIKAERGGTVEPEDTDLQETVVTRLHKLFGQFVNRAMRFAVRLDEEDQDDNGDTRENALAARLAGPAHYEPHSALEREEEIEEPRKSSPRSSLKRSRTFTCSTSSTATAPRWRTTLLSRRARYARVSGEQKGLRAISRRPSIG